MNSMDSTVLPQGSTKVRTSTPILGLILMLLAAVVGGVIIGGIVAVTSQFFYLILLMPALMAIAGGWIMAKAVRMGRVRSSVMALIFGVLIGLIIYGTYRYGEYYAELNPAVNRLMGKDMGVAAQYSDAEIEARINQALKQQTGQAGFVGYTLLKAHKGEQVHLGSATSSSSSGLNFTNFTLSEPLTWGYWIIEVLVIAGGAGLAASKAAGQAFCDQDGKFYATRSLGRVQKDQADAFMNASKAGDWAQARSYMVPNKGKAVYPYLDVSASKCPSCNTNPVSLTISRKMNSKSSGTMKVLGTTLTPAQYAMLDSTATAPMMGMA